MLRSKWMILLACVAIGGGGYWYFFMRTSSVSTPTNQVIRVTLGSLSSSVKTTGKISPIQTTSLPFAKKGIVTKIEKKVGDEVKSGEIIAEIDTQDASMNIRNAQIALDNANNNYTKLFTSTSEADKLRAKTTYEESKNALTLLESQYLDFITAQKNTLTEAELALSLLSEKVKLAESELDYAKKNTAINNDSSNLERDIANAFLTVEEMNRFFPDTIRSFRDFLYIENLKSDYYGDLGANNTYQKANTEKLYTTVSGSIIDFEKSLASLRNTENRTLDEVLGLLTASKNILTDLNTLSAMAIDEYANSYINITIPQTFIDSQQALLRTLGSTISSKLSSLNSTYTTLKNYGTDEIQALSNKNTVTQKEQSLQSTKNDQSKAERAYKALLTSQSTDRVAKQNETSRQKNTVELNELTYKELLAGPESTDQKSAKNNIAAAEINLTKAYIALKDYQIIAPFDGTINDIPWIVGDTAGDSSATSNTEEGILIENKNMYEINLSLDQIDIVKVKPGMRANITLDAFPGESYTGSVASISALPTETSGVVSYEAKIILTLSRTDVFSKMSTTVEILTTEKENVIVIPTSAITSEGGKSYVNKAKDPTIITRLASANRPAGFSGSSRSFSGEMRNMPSGSGGFTGSGRNFAMSGEMMGSGRSLSGAVRNFSGRVRSGPSASGIPLTTTEDIPTEKVEITLGLSSGGSTEVISGLTVGDVIVIQSKTTSTKSGASPSTTSTRAPGVGGGFGGGRPPGF